MPNLVRQIVRTMTSRGARSVPERPSAQRPPSEVDRRYLDLFEGSGIPMLLFDRASLTVLEANMAAEEALGRVQSELLGARLTAFLASDAPPMAHVAAEGSTAALPAYPLGDTDTAKLRRKDGRPLTARLDWFEFRGRPVGVARLSESGTLAPSVRLVRGLMESAPDAMVVVARDGTILLVNAQTEQLFGYRRDELLGRPLETLVPRRFRSRHIAQRAEFDTSRAPRPMGSGMQLYALRKNGTEFPVDIALSSVAHDGQWVTISAIRDVSERVAAAGRLAQLAAAVEAANDAIIGTMLDGTICSWNPAAERIYGWCAANALGRPMAELFPGERVDEAHDMLRRVLAGEPVMQAEFSLRRGAGEPRHVTLIARAARDSGDAVVGASLIARDTSEQRREHDKLDNLSLEFERRVAERTAELRRSVDQMEGFATMAAHDLQEPVRTVSSFAQLLDRRCRDRLDAEGVELLEHLVEAAARMHAQIVGLGEYAAVGAQSRPASRLSLDRALQDALQGLRPAIEESGATVACDPLPEALADGAQMVLLFRHLVDNALKFRAHGVKPLVRVEAKRAADGWTLGVRDNGIGIAPQHLERVFGMFQRLHGRGEYGGTGIGLAICRRIVERHGGRIWAESSPLAGSCFHFTLPHPRGDA